MSKLWSGRFSCDSSALLDRFNASIEFDKKLYKEDIKGSIAHSLMLLKQKIITQDEQKQIEMALNQIQQEIVDDEFVFSLSDEDIHMAIEKRLISIIGDTGKKLHTARSRNDQVATDFRLFVMSKNEQISKQLLELISTMNNLAKKHTSTLLPGMTHLQHAQPINFGFHLLAYCSMFKRDYERFVNSKNRNNISPLGSAALAGTPHNIDREFTAQKLGFDSVSINALDSVSDRDFALEILFNISMLFMHISRLSEELILWSSSEFSFVTISDTYSTGSSIMPQKKNPDVPELLRGKTGRAFGNLMSLLTIMKGLPLAYNKDTQEDKESVFDSVENIEISLEILTEVISTITINRQNMLKACGVGHLTATDLADYLVGSCGIAFREAHEITGKTVRLAEEKSVDISKLSLEDLQSIDKRVTKDALKYLDIQNSMNSRNSQGGTSSTQTKEQIEYFATWIKKEIVSYE
jgi:argininosuccinate lyase